MPYHEEMNWDSSKRRWHRYHQGVMYRVAASKLGDIPTRDATRQAANDWWQKKEAELNGLVPKGEPDPQVVSMLAEIDGPDPVTTAMVEAFIETQPAGKAKSSDRSIKATGERFLAVIRDETMKPMTLREIKDYIDDLTSQLGAESDVSTIDAEKVEHVALTLRKSSLSAGAKKKRWGFFKRYIKYLWSRHLIELPRNLDSFSFKVRPQTIKTYTVEEIRTVLKSLKPRLRLFALLGLNCGMTNADIGTMSKDMINLSTGTLTRRRVKTATNDNVPTVTYKLWKETLQLLEQCWSDHPTLVLTSADGTSLYDARFEGEQTRKKDLLALAWKRAKVTIPLKAFRSIAATWIESHEIYGRCTSYFLGHSPKSIKDRHYAAPPQQLFDDALDWLHEHLFT